MRRAFRALARRWFLVLLAAALLLGPLAPGPGRALSAHVGLLIVAVLFLMSLTLPLSRLLDAAQNGRVLALSAVVTYALVPAICFASARLLFSGRELVPAGPELERQADDLVPCSFEERGGDGAVDPAAHRDGDAQGF